MSRSPATRPPDPGEPRDTLLLAAQAGWGTTLRFGLLRCLDRWPAVVLAAVGASAAGGGLATASWIAERLN